MSGWLPPQPPELSDDVVVLRAITRLDVPWLAAACSDPDIVRWTPLHPGISAAQIAA